MTTPAEQRSYEAVAHTVAALSFQCAAAPEKIIDILTGYLWDEEEAGILKNTEALKHLQT